MMVEFSRWSIKVKGQRWRQWSLRTSRFSLMGTPSLVWRSIEPMGKRNSSWSPKKRSSLSHCINANTKSRAGNKKIFKIKAIFTVIFKEIMGKGGHGNPHLFPVNQILNLKIKYPVPRRKNQDYFFPSRRILISQSVLSNKLTQTEIIPPLTRQVCVEKKKYMALLV